jgi:hypothetical protein
MGLEGKIDARSKLQEALEGVRTLGDRFKDAVPSQVTTTVRLEMDATSRSSVLSELEAARKEQAWTQERAVSPSSPLPTPLPEGEQRAPSSVQERAFGQRPHPRAWRKGEWDKPEDHPDADPKRLQDLASAGWKKLREGGALQTLRESGRFGSRWGELLEGEEAKEQRAWANTSARPEGRKISDAFEGIEQVGSRISKLLKEVRRGGEDAIKAADQLKKAREALKKLGESGQTAAQSLGGPQAAALQEELGRAQKTAEAGLAPPEPEEEAGSKVNPRRFLSLLQNPTGSAMAALEEGLLSRYGGALSGFLGQNAWKAFSGSGIGGAGGAAGAGLAGSAAVAAGLYAGYRIQLGRANDTVQDAGKALDDARLSQGQGFDYRGAFWDKDRLRTKDETPLEAREILRGLGVSLRASSFKAPDGLMPFTKDVAAKADLLGLDAPRLASMMGAAMRSGTLERSAIGADRLTNLLSNWRDEALKHGVTMNERLGVISQLSAQSVQQTGFLTERGLRTFGEATSLLDRTEHPSLQGEAGAGVLQSLTRMDRTDPQKALLMSQFFNGKHLTSLGWERAKADLRPEDLEALLNTEGEWGVTRALMESPSSLLAGSQATARQMGGLPLWLQQGMLGLERNGTVQSLRAIEALRKGDDLSGKSDRPHGLYAESEELSREARGARAAQSSGVHEEDKRASTMTWETAVNLKDFSTDMKDVVRQFAQAVDDFAGTGRHPMTWKERGVSALMASPGTMGFGLSLMNSPVSPSPVSQSIPQQGARR